MYVPGVSARESSRRKSSSRKPPRRTKYVNPPPKCYNAEYKQIPCPHSKGGKIAAIVIGSVVGAILLGILSFFLCRHWRRRRAEKAAPREEEESRDEDAQPLKGREADDDDDDDRRHSGETLPAYNYDKLPELSYPFPATYAVPAHPGGS